MTPSKSPADRRLLFSGLALCAVLVLGVGPAVAAGGSFKVEYEKAVAAYKAGDYERSLTLFKKAYKIKKHPLCLFGMAQSHRKLDHVSEAITNYEKYLVTKPGADLKREVDGYLKDLKVAKKSLDATAEGRKLYAVGEFANAAAAYERAYELRPRPELLYNIGLAYQQAGNGAKAVEYYERFLGGTPGPDLKVEAEKALAELRDEPDPVGSMGPDGSGTGSSGGSGSSSAALSTDGPKPAKAGGKKTGLYIGLGVGGGVVVVGAAVVVTIILLTGGVDIPDSDLGNMTVTF